MTKLMNFESDELYDSSGSGSGEEYVPGCSDDSSDTDESCVTESKDQENFLLKCFTDVSDEDGSLSAAEASVNVEDSKQTFTRGRSPTRKKKSDAKRKRQRCSSSNRTSEKLSKLKKISNSSSPSLNLAPVVVDENPPAGLSDGSPSIPAVCKRSSGSRIYNKKQFCLYCKKGFIKMSRHLERVHYNKPDVAKAVAFPKGSKKRRLLLEHLRNRGNFAHNVEVLNTGSGNLVPRKLPRNVSQAENFLHCIFCQGLFARKVLWRHVKICKFKSNIENKTGKTRVQSLCAFAVPPPPGVKEEFWKVLNNMNQDNIFLTIKSETFILEYGEHLFNRLGHDAGKHEYIRQKMRELGRLLICSRKITPLMTIEDHIMPKNFMHVVKAVKHLAGYSTETHTYKCPSLALKIGYSLTKISQLAESRANVQGNYNAAKDARAFRKVYDARWNELVSSASHRTLQEAKWNVPQLLPFTKDVQILHQFLNAEQQQYSKKLSEETSSKTFANLAKVTLTQVILFNRRRAGEVSKMPLSAYLSAPSTQDDDDASVALSDLEKKLCQHFKRVEIRGKRGRKVPVLLTPRMQESLDLLVAKREECEVPKDNIYLFGRASAWSCYRGSDCLRHYAKTCGAKSPENITSTKLRKQTGTLSQILNLSNAELDQLADFLGHDIRVHRQFYRLPDNTIQLAKISKVLMALEQGRLAEFQGKNLDDIIIGPEGIFLRRKKCCVFVDIIAARYN